MKRPLFIFGLIFLSCAAASALVARGAGVALGLALAFLALIFGRGERTRLLSGIAAVAVLLEWACFAVYDWRFARLESLFGRSFAVTGYVSRTGELRGSLALRAPVDGTWRIGSAAR